MILYWIQVILEKFIKSKPNELDSCTISRVLHTNEFPLMYSVAFWKETFVTFLQLKLVAEIPSTSKDVIFTFYDHISFPFTQIKQDIILKYFWQGHGN